MNSVETRYGQLKSVEFRSLYSNGKTDGCMVSEKNVLMTPFGTLVPLYETEDMGRRSVKPVYFYKDGSLKSLPLQSTTAISTSIGEIPAELITFHKNGSLKRIFPLDGKLSGFWSWQNELSLAREITITTPAGELTAKFIAVQFYENGALKSLTLWPGQRVTLTTPYGEQEVRKGIAFYENGQIRSFEPLKRMEIPTPIGVITAYDNEPNGIHGDLNSVQLDKNGLVSALSTIDNEIAITFPDNNVVTCKPGVKNNVCGDERKVSVPMKVRFEKNCIIINDGAPFELSRHSFTVKKHNLTTQPPSYSCAG
ncbi:hypothetical protein CR161_05645 [Prosthecochloris sp. ZM]|uniref:hypothetical protein n=1 Tax=Prosthecochloris sp. ZM TaxID=2283143 RepID=UPI000DF78EA6|nr:hypothetical protein [Prosthecochloris sp. ZM]RDD30231.1 hypothetical protein CR161_05645 [Prosthecochloris sp. ZM]